MFCGFELSTKTLWQANMDVENHYTVYIFDF